MSALWQPVYGHMSFRTELCFTGIVSDDKGMPRFDRILVLTESQLNLQNVSDPQLGLALLMKKECIPFGVWGKSIRNWSPDEWITIPRSFG